MSLTQAVTMNVTHTSIMNVTQASIMNVTQTSIMNVTQASVMNVTESSIMNVTQTVTTQASQASQLMSDPFHVSDQGRATAEEVLRLLRPVLIPVGLIATVVNIVVFLKPSMKSSAAVYVIAISVGQLVNILLSLAQQIMGVVIASPYTNYTYWLYDVYFVSTFTAIAKRGSYVIMCLMSSERLYAVLRPLHVKDFILSRQPVQLSVASYVFATAMHLYIPVCSKVGVIKIGGGVMVRTIYTRTYSALYLDSPDACDGFSLAAKVLLVFVPLVALLLLTVLTVWGLRRHADAFSRMTSSGDADSAKRRRQELQLTMVMLVATVSYVILSLPYGVHFLCSTLFPEYYGFRGELSNLYNVVLLTVANLTFLNCAADFFCFLAASSRFRSTLRSLILSWRCRRRRREATSDVSMNDVTKYTSDKTEVDDVDAM